MASGWPALDVPSPSGVSLACLAVLGLSPWRLATELWVVRRCRGWLRSLVVRGGSAGLSRGVDRGVIRSDVKTIRPEILFVGVVAL